MVCYTVQYTVHCILLYLERHILHHTVHHMVRCTALRLYLYLYLYLYLLGLCEQLECRAAAQEVHDGAHDAQLRLLPAVVVESRSRSSCTRSSSVVVLAVAVEQ